MCLTTAAVQVAAVTGLASGLIEWGAGGMGKTGGVTLDVLVGISSGMITGFSYNNWGKNICMSSVLLGTLYWFFYGTAFVIGLLEIIAGELETGVTRFIAVSVKTFVLCLGSGLGLMIVLNKDTAKAWAESESHCGLHDLDVEWWRIPLYLLCSASVLGQYRFPIRHWWRGLFVQLAGYEVQYQVQKEFSKLHNKDNMDYALSNTLGAAAAVFAACLLSFMVEHSCHGPYQKRILHTKSRQKDNAVTSLHYDCTKRIIKLVNCTGIGRKSDVVILDVEKKLEAAVDPTNMDVIPPITLEPHEEHVLFQTIVELEDHNVRAFEHSHRVPFRDLW
jgi:hypothetical protein